LRAALKLAFPDGPVAVDEREEYTLGLPEPVEAAGLDDAFPRVYRDRPNDFGPT
jgi:hypothetical protein